MSLEFEELNVDFFTQFCKLHREPAKPLNPLIAKFVKHKGETIFVEGKPVKLGCSMVVVKSPPSFSQAMLEHIGYSEDHPNCVPIESLDEGPSNYIPAYFFEIEGEHKSEVIKPSQQLELDL